MFAQIRGKGREVDVAQPKHQRSRLNASALVALLRGDAGGSRHQRIGGCVDDDLSAIATGAADRRKRCSANGFPIELRR